MLIGMVSLVFSTASQSTRRAQSSSAAYRDIRNVVAAIRRDLEKVTPSDGLMCIVGAEITAYRTPEDAATQRVIPDPMTPERDTYRADLLMVLTDRMLESYAHPQVPVTPPAMVFYGHADFGKIDPAGTTWTQIRLVEGGNANPPFVNTTTPASEWHLARRTTVFPVTLIGAPFPPTPDDATLRTAEYDICDQSLGILTANLSSGRYLRNKEDNTWYFYNNGFAGVSTYKLMNPVTHDWDACTSDVYAYDYETWQDCVGGYSPNTNVDGNYVPETAQLMFYDPAAAPAERRTRLDPAPPPEQAHRTAHFFLPRCSWFHVEYTYDDPREVLYGGIATPGEITAPIRWHSVEPGEQIWWRGPLEPEPLAGPTGMDRWPRALRITFELYTGSEGNAEPIQYTLIHTW
ncbi:MAG: hypothetical protein JXA69_01505 [Phycisphaerae bacterium]|nr:hypothetical protein [Phycisphaerae bacterium]